MDRYYGAHASRPLEALELAKTSKDANDAVSLENTFMKLKAKESGSALPENRARIREAVYNFLEATNPANRLPGLTRILVEEAIQSDDVVDLPSLHQALVDLESYALRLAWHPWKKQFWRITV